MRKQTSTEGAKMKIATYCRISTDEQRQPYSLDAQRDRLDSYIASQDGWKQVRSYSDQTSGKTLKRPGLDRALADAKAGCYFCSCSRSTGWHARSPVSRGSSKDSTAVACLSAPLPNPSIPRHRQGA